MNAPAKFGKDIALAFVRTLTGDGNALIRVRVIDDNKERKLAPAEESGTVETLWPSIEAAQAQGIGVFIIPNLIGYAGAKDFVKDDDATAFPALFTDHDGNVPDKWHRQPDAIVTTSPGKVHAYWLIAPGATTDEWVQAQRRLIAFYGSDRAIKNPSRVMRLPGTLHQKGSPFPVTFTAYDNDLATFGLPTIAEVLDGIPAEIAEQAKPVTAPEGVITDAPTSVYRAMQRIRNLIARGDVAVQGNHGDDRTVQLACEMHDLALSEEKAFTVMAPWNEACQPIWEPEEFRAKITNAYKSAENELGCWYTPPASETFAGLSQVNDLHAVIPIPARYRRAARFPGYQPRKRAENTDDFDWHRALTTRREPLAEEEITELLTTHRYDKRRNASEREYAARFAFVAAGLRRGHTPQELYATMVAHGNDRHMAGIKDADDPSHTLRTEIENVSRTLGDDLNKAVVRIIDGQEAQTVDKIEEAILSQAVPIFESDSVVVTPGEFSFKAHSRDVTTMRLIEINAASFANIVNRAIELQRFSKTEKAWLPVNCPDNIAKNFMQRHGGHILHPVAGITLVPVLREDGSILNEAGYDSSTGLIYEPCGVEFPEAKANPTKADAKLALDFLMDPLRLVPFATPAAKSVAASGFLSLLARRVIGNVPVHGIDATAPGSGKTLLVDCASVLGTGEVAQPVILAPNDEENTKTLAALLRQGSQLISYDNVTYPLGFAALESAVVSERPQARILGMTKTFTATNNSVIYANGNSFSVQGDMHRRTLVCRIDAQEEHPERRQFDFNPLDLYRDNRPAYVLAALTILRAYIVADKPDRPPRLGSFEGWSDLIRGALMWLGYADPVETQATIMEDNSDLVQLGYLLEQLEATGLRSITSQNITKAITSAEAGPTQRDLADAISNIAGSKDNKLDMKALGKFLEKHKGRIVNGRRIEPDGYTCGARRWSLFVRKS